MLYCMYSVSNTMGYISAKELSTLFWIVSVVVTVFAETLHFSVLRIQRIKRRISKGNNSSLPLEIFTCFLKFHLFPYFLLLAESIVFPDIDFFYVEYNM